MFDIGWSEMLVVGAVALVVIGPKDLPAALRQAGKWMGAVRRMAADFQGQVNEAMREAELDELRREVQNLKSGVSGLADPIRTAGNEVKTLVEAKPEPDAGAQSAPPADVPPPASPSVSSPSAGGAGPAAKPKRAAARKTASEASPPRKAPRKKVESKT